MTRLEISTANETRGLEPPGAISLLHRPAWDNKSAGRASFTLRPAFKIEKELLFNTTDNFKSVKIINGERAVRRGLSAQTLKSLKISQNKKPGQAGLIEFWLPEEHMI